MSVKRQGPAQKVIAIARKGIADARSELWRGPRVRGMFGLWPVRSVA